MTSSRSCARSNFAAEARERCRPARHIYRTQASWPSCRSCQPPSPRASAADLPCPKHCVVLLSANAVPIVVARKADRESPRRRTHAPLCAPAQALSVSSQRNCVSTLQRAMRVHHLAEVHKQSDHNPCKARSEVRACRTCLYVRSRSGCSLRPTVLSMFILLSSFSD